MARARSLELARVSLAAVLWLVSLPAVLGGVVGAGLGSEAAPALLPGAAGEAPLALAESIGAARPESRFGPFRTSPDTDAPKHAYSPFDDSGKQAGSPASDYVPGQVMVKFKSGAVEPGGRLRSGPGLGPGGLSGDHGVAAVDQVLPNAGASGGRLQSSATPSRGLERWYRAKLREGTSVADAVKALAGDAAVEAVEPDYLRRMAALPGAGTDPRYSEQWHLAAIRAPEAWQFLESNGIDPGGRRDVVVAVIDTGVDYAHPDLAANMWVNSAEFGGVAGVDDDNNGFVDDIHGANVVSTLKTGDPMDDHGHGTHVAGIIAAQAGNGVGGVGVAYNTQVMAIKAAQYSGALSSSDIAEAVYYAVEKGADVINMSFGGYSKSQLEEDALAVAFGQAVLVAAAGNDGKPNLPHPRGADMYPAAYNWVLGVMARSQSANAQGDYLASFSNYDWTPRDGHEYELMAPGVDIPSALPGGQYAAWDGTSMAAPVVSGMAALVRSYFWDKNSYSSRFIMGQIASTGATFQGISLPDGTVKSYRNADAFTALTETPRPELSYLEHWLFDTTAQAAGNDADGIVDAGETVDLAVVIRNHWGQAADVNVNLEARAEGAGENDPYVAFAAGMDTVNYGAIGSFNWDDNGLVYDAQGAITGVSPPFRFTVSAGTPNDHIIPFLLTMTAKNGLNLADSAVYTFQARFNLIVQRGKQVPSIIATNTTLTKADLWIIDRPVLIEPGITLTVTEGTQIQFWSSDPSMPYGTTRPNPYLHIEGTLLVQGTANEPVEMYVSPHYLGRLLEVRQSPGGHSELRYVKIMNPVLGPYSLNRYSEPLDIIDHAYFFQDIVDRIDYADQTVNAEPRSIQINARQITNSIFYKLGGGSQRPSNVPYAYCYALQLVDGSKGNLYDSCYISNKDYASGGREIQDNVFLINVRNINGPFSHVSKVYGAGLPLPNSDLSPGVEAQTFKNNAILNLWLDPDPGHWLIFESVRSSYNSEWTLYIGNNYWGTTSTNLIDSAIADYADGLFDRHRIAYQPILTTPAETTYPFVWKVDISQGGQSLTRLGPGDTTFTITFNRDMDTTVQPSVSFGPDTPVTDYTIHPIGGGWQNARTWRGAFNINPITGDGYQLMRIAGPARAASDPWLVIGDDAGRFRFEIITSGTEAMNLQATGAQGRVDLAWTQNDFDMLAGYNLYRSTSTGGTYTRLNTTIIPAAQKTYTDTGVQPGQPYYYKFTVVKTDMSESSFSNVAPATPTDTIPPVISHTPLSSAAPGMGLQIYADVTDNVQVTSVTLYHRAKGTATYTTRDMVKTTGNRYSATLEGALVTAPGLEYYIQATDGVSIVRSGQADLPHQVTVSDSPQVTGVSPNRGDAAGGTTVTVSGSNFKTGATVTFGGAVAGSVTLVSANQITCTTPPHFPGVVDVVVANQDGGTGALLRAFTYESANVPVSLPDVVGEAGSIIEIPVSADNVSGLRAAQIVVQFDGSVLTARGARTGSITPGFSVEANTSVVGQVTVGLASSSTVSGSGVLAYLEFQVTGAPGASCELALASVSLNDGAIPMTLDNGTFTVKSLLSVSGNVRYYQDSRAVPDVSLALSGQGSYSGATAGAGSYTITGVPAGNYVLTPARSGDAGAITSYDASFILRASVGTLSLTAYQTKAADVDRSGSVTPMDASYVLEKSAQLIDVPFPGAGKVWDFDPASRSYQPLGTDVTGQDFTAILIGDVSGNWGQSGGLGSGLKSGPAATLALPNIKTLPQRRVTAALDLSLAQASLYGADIVLGYSPAAVAAVLVEKAALASGFSSALNLKQPGTIRIALAGSSPIAAGGTLLSATLDVVGAPGTVSPLSIVSATFNEGAIPTTLSGGSLTIVPFGDANSDLRVDARDITGVERIVAGLDVLEPGADANGDGAFNALDITKVERIIAGLG